MGQPPLDRGYETGAVHRGLELLGITGYIPAFQFSNLPEKYGFSYDLERSCDDIRPDYSFDVSCQGTVPEAIIAFLDSSDFEHAIRLAVSLGGDSDTLACITGGIAEAYYGMPEDIKQQVYNKLPNEFLKVVSEFRNK